MQNNLIYLYPAQETVLAPQEKHSGFKRFGQIAARAIELFAAVGIFLCIGVCTLLFFTML